MNATTQPLPTLAPPAKSPFAHSPISARIPGNKGIWVGIFCELTEFALMFSVYFIARSHHPQAFSAGVEQLSLIAGTANTIFMLSSSYAIAQALASMRNDMPKTSLYWLAAALVLGLGYPLVKFFEVRWNIAHGLDGSAGIFFTTYYYLTFNHLVHVSWGLLGILWVMVRTYLGIYSATDHQGLEALGCYWHSTDLIWLTIFPLFYVLH